jgi:valyl-tRNA synthetase
MAKFCLFHFEKNEYRHQIERDKNSTLLLNRFILSRLAAAVKECHTAFDNYRLFEASTALSRFIVDDLCDVFLEYSKPVLHSESPV